MEKIEAKVVKKGSEYCVVSKDGSKNLGCYATREEAVKRLREVEYFKNQGAVPGFIVAKESPDIVQYGWPEKAISSEEASSIIEKNTVRIIDHDGSIDE